MLAEVRCGRCHRDCGRIARVDDVLALDGGKPPERIEEERQVISGVGALSDAEERELQLHAWLRIEESVPVQEGVDDRDCPQDLRKIDALAIELAVQLPKRRPRRPGPEELVNAFKDGSLFFADVRELWGHQVTYCATALPRRTNSPRVRSGAAPRRCPYNWSFADSQSSIVGCS